MSKSKKEYFIGMIKLSILFGFILLCDKRFKNVIRFLISRSSLILPLKIIAVIIVLLLYNRVLFGLCIILEECIDWNFILNKLEGQYFRTLEFFKNRKYSRFFKKYKVFFQTYKKHFFSTLQGSSRLRIPFLARKALITYQSFFIIRKGRFVYKIIFIKMPFISIDLNVIFWNLDPLILSVIYLSINTFRIRFFRGGRFLGEIWVNKAFWCEWKDLL